MLYRSWTWGFTATLAIVLCMATPATDDIGVDTNGWNSEWVSIYGANTFSCSLCHTSSIPALNDYGADMEDRTLILQGIEGVDSDGDSASNIDEINASTNPGDSGSTPTSADDVGIDTSGWNSSWVGVYGAHSFSCGLCHTSVPALNGYGADMIDRNLIIIGLEGVDSDGDGTNNAAEISAGFNPGDAMSAPAAGPTYVGSGACQGCHSVPGRNQYPEWEMTLHAQAYNEPVADNFLPVWSGIVSIEDSGRGLGPLWVQLVEDAGTYTALLASDEGMTQVIAGPMEIVRVHAGQPIAANGNNNVIDAPGTVRGLRSNDPNPIYPNGPDYYPGESPYLGKQRYHVTINSMEFILPIQYNPTADLDRNKGGWVEYHLRDWIDGDFNLVLGPNHSEQRRCAGCHQTGLTEVTWVPASSETVPGSTHDIMGAWATDVVEPVIGCEMCHGPGSDHAMTASAADIVNPSDLTQAEQTDLCGFCHSRGVSQAQINGTTLGYPYRDAEPHRWVPGDVWGDFYVEGGGYWVDTPELRVASSHHQQYEEFVLSNHYTDAGMTCADCHDTHSTAAQNASIEHDLQMTARGVASAGQEANLCYSCHQATLFPNDTDTDRERHYWHPPQGTHGSPDCTNCHMPTTAKSGVAYDIHTHSFTQLGPELTLADAAPNSCMVMCHGGPFGTSLAFPGPTNPNFTSWTDLEDTQIATFLASGEPRAELVAAYLVSEEFAATIVDEHEYMQPALDSNRDTPGDTAPFTIDAADVVTFIEEGRP